MPIDGGLPVRRTFDGGDARVGGMDSRRRDSLYDPPLVGACRPTN